MNIPKPIEFKTREEARAFLKRAGLLNTSRVLEGEERKKVMTMLRLMGPGKQSNNQHIWTESWTVGDVTYNYHVGENFEELEEVTEDDI